MSVDFPPAFANELVAFGKREGFTSYMTLLAAWQALLHRYSGQTDIVVGTPIANRTLPELQPLIGYVAHSVALRTDLGGDPTFRELLGRVREVMLRRAEPPGRALRAARRGAVPPARHRPRPHDGQRLRAP